MKDGYLIQPRHFFESDMWCRSRVYSPAEAWLDIIQMATFEDKSLLIGWVKHDLQKGQLVASHRFLASRWRWGKGKTERFLTYLKTGQRITVETGRGISVLTIVNYSVYQDLGTYYRGDKKSKNGARTGRERGANGAKLNKEKQKDMKTVLPPTIKTPGTDPHIKKENKEKKKNFYQKNGNQTVRPKDDLVATARAFVLAHPELAKARAAVLAKSEMPATTYNDQLEARRAAGEPRVTRSRPPRSDD